MLPESADSVIFLEIQRSMYAAHRLITPYLDRRQGYHLTGCMTGNKKKSRRKVACRIDSACFCTSRILPCLYFAYCKY
jgi:hypothetical protein